MWILLCMTEIASTKVPEWTLGDRLTKAMRQAGLSVADMAAKLGVSRNTITNYCHDKVTVTTATIIAWSLITQVPREWLEKGEGSLRPTPPDDGGVGIQDDALAKLTAMKRSRSAAGSDSGAATHWYGNAA